MQKTTSPTTPGVWPAFLNKFGAFIQGTLCGWDRLRLRGTLRHLFQPTVMEAYLNACRVLIKDFGQLAESLTLKVKAAAYATAEKLGRPLLYLPSSQTDQGELAEKIAQREGIKDGLIAIFSCVEPCLSYVVRGNRQTKEIHLELTQRKCLHFYHYYQHAQFGLMHVRVQSWFPFTVDISLNGRHWLARQMDQAGIAYRQRGNCFVWISDWGQAQALMDQQIQTDWSRVLGPILDQTHPLHREIARPIAQEYYWTASSTEYATDVVFQQAADLAKLYPCLVHHGISSFSCRDVMRFLGRRVPEKTGKVHAKFQGEIISDVKERPEGIRLKHSLNGNSLKLYDKEGRVLRTETTIDHTLEFRVYRTSERDPEGKLGWRPLRRGVADLPRRASVSQAANNRYLTALAAVTGTTPLSQLVNRVCTAVTREGLRYRGLRPWSEQDGRLLEILSQGEAMINGFRNRDLRSQLYPRHQLVGQQTKRAAAVTRKLRLLRAHGLIRKVSGTHRYVVTENGRIILTALMAARKADVNQLTKMAA